MQPRIDELLVSQIDSDDEYDKKSRSEEETWDDKPRPWHNRDNDLSDEDDARLYEEQPKWATRDFSVEAWHDECVKKGCDELAIKALYQLAQLGPFGRFRSQEIVQKLQWQEYRKPGAVVHKSAVNAYNEVSEAMRAAFDKNPHYDPEDDEDDFGRTLTPGAGSETRPRKRRR